MLLDLSREELFQICRSLSPQDQALRDRLSEIVQSSPDRNMLTPRQREYLEWIEQYIREWGIAPTYREIQIGMNVGSVSCVQNAIAHLMEKGFIGKRAIDGKGKARILSVY